MDKYFDKSFVKKKVIKIKRSKDRFYLMGRRQFYSSIFLLLFIISLYTSIQTVNNTQNKSLNIYSANPTDKIDPQIISDIDKMGGLENISDNYKVRVIIVLYDQYPASGFAIPMYINVLQYYTIINGFLADLVLKRVFNLADYPQIRSIWYDRAYNGIPTGEQVSSIKNFLQSSSSDNNSEFMNFTKEIGADKLWEKGINGSQVVIAVLDSGIDLTGQIGGDLDDFDDNLNTTDPKFLGAVSLVPDEPLYYTDFTGIGTFHAGIACGTGATNKSYVGVAPGANFLNVKIYDSFGLTYWSFMISGVEWSIEHSADILLFCRDIPGIYIDPISIAITNAVKKGLVVVSPTGNDGPSYMSVTTPGDALGAITVGALDMHSEQVANFSSRGPGLDFRTVPDIIAPGVDLIGPRARIFTNDTFKFINSVSDMLSQYGMGELPDIQFTVPEGVFPQPQYGDPINENYTRASGTGAAAAVVAGAIALLIQAFPLANPQILRTAICNTARVIKGDLNSEGAGVINVSAAYDYLYQFFGETNYTRLPFSVPLIYSGFISTSDTANWTQNQTDLAGINAWDMTELFSTQAMMSIVMITNGTSNETADFTQIHLTLNQFGLYFDGRNHWFSEFRVDREFHQMNTVNIGAEAYNRYAGILELGGLYVVVVAETWNYYADFVTIGNTQVVTKYHDRINGFKLNFNIINLRKDKENISEPMLIAYFKADLFLNETGALSANNTEGIGNVNQQNATEGALSILTTGFDDNFTFDPTTQTMRVYDMNNNTNYTYADKYAEMGFNSTSHQLTGYKIANSTNLLLNLTMDKLSSDYFDNSSNYIRGKEDPGFVMAWNLTDSLNYSDSVNFSSIFSMGLGENYSTAHQSLYNQMDYLSSKVAFYPIQDLIIVKASFNRMAVTNQLYNSSALIFNIGNTIVNTSYAVFGSNRTTETGSIEVYSRIKIIDHLDVGEFIEINQTWMPLEDGIYLVGWGIIVLEVEQYGYIETEDNILNNFMARSVYVYDLPLYEHILFSSFSAYPNKMDNEPMKIHFAGDIGLYNITTYGIMDIPNVSVSLDGPGQSYVKMMWRGPDIFSQFNLNDLLNSNNNSNNGSGFGDQSLGGDDLSGNSSSSFLNFSDSLYTKELHPFDSIFLIAFGAFLCPQGKVQFNITFSSTAYNNGEVFYRIPVEFEFREYRGRVFWDGIHNFLIQGTNLSDIMAGHLEVNLDNFIDLDERLDYPYGNYNDLRTLWAHNTPKGVAVQTFLPGISINITDMMQSMMASQEDQTQTNNSEAEQYGINTSLSMDTNFITNMMGGFSLEGDILTTNTINHNILQFFDVLVVEDPELEINDQEIANITDWVQKGGSLIVLAENKSENQVGSLNKLLQQFNLSISSVSDEGGGEKTVITRIDPGDIFPRYNIGELKFMDPVNISIVPGVNDGADKVELLCKYIGVAEKGRGRVAVVGDKDIFSNQGLMRGNNSLFAQKLINWALQVHFDLNITATNKVMDLYQYNYFHATIENYNSLKTYVDEGVLFITSFIYHNSTIVNISFYGYELPLMIMFMSNPGKYETYFYSGWFNETGVYYAMFLIDHPAIAQEMTYYNFTVNYAPPPTPVELYKFPQSPYPHWVDMLGIIWIVFMGLLIWLYSSEKWKTRFKIIQLKGEVLNQTKTKINEGMILFKQILRGISVTKEELEQIRIFLNNRKRLNRYLKDLKKFGDEIGERYD
ncbi:MAG: DUF4350 domain-containing protein [Promethearchaeota archaeon]